MAGEDQVVDQADQVAEQHRAEAGDDAQAKRQQRELGERQWAGLFALHQMWPAGDAALTEIVMRLS